MRCFLTFILLFVLTCRTDAAGPSIESISPGIGQRDSEFTLKLVGAGLNDASDVLLYSADVSCVDLRAVSDNELSVRLRASSDCRLGSHPFRVRTPYGISELRIFRVTPLPLITAVEPNETPKQAMAISNNVTVTGVLEKGDVDCFQVQMHRGERLSAEVEAVRMGSNMVDAVLTVSGPDGSCLANVDDTPLFAQDPFLTLIAPVDGSYVIRVQEANLEGDENSRYALHIGSFPRPASVFPAGGPVGKQVDIRFDGDAAGAFARRVTLPDSPENDFGLFADHLGMKPPTPNPFRISPFENVLEIEPNDDREKVTVSPIELPIAFNGILTRPGDIDLFRFPLSAGQTFQFEAFADRIGSPADTVISILQMDGTVLVSNDDYDSHDSRLVFQAPKTGEYLLQVSDQRGNGGTNFVYRIEATQPQAELITFLPRPDRLSQERQAISVPRGNRVLTFLAVKRHGVDGDVRLTPQGLPTGIKAFSAMIPSDRFLVPVVIEAGTDAPLNGGLVRILATGEVEGSTVTGGFQQVVDLVNASADRLYQAVTVDRLAIAVVEAAPFTIQLDAPKSPLSQDGTIELTVHVIRNSGFTDAIDVTFPFLPPWVDGPAKITIPGDRNSGVYVLHAFPEANPRTWQLCAEGCAVAVTARGAAPIDIDNVPSPRRGRRSKARNDIAVATQLVDLKITESPVTGKIARVSAEQGSLLEVACSVERHGPVQDRLEAVLEGLPNRVKTEPVTLEAGDSCVKFAIKLDSTAPIGQFNSLICRLKGKIGDQAISYCIGRGGVLKIEPPGGLVTDAEGRPLSPLEALRKTQNPAVKPRNN
jgi:hypothetical protein